MNNRNKARRPLRGMAAVAVLAILSFGLSACSSSATNDLSPQESNVFITNYDKQANFSQYRTYSLPDSVLVETNNGYRTSAASLERQVVARVATELTNRGFVRSPGGEAADLGVAITRVSEQFTGVAQNPFVGAFGNYWGGGFGPWGGVGMFDPFFFPGSFQFYTVTEQSWRIDIFDLKNRPTVTPGSDLNAPQNRLRVLFTTQLRGNGIFDPATINEVIANVFTKFPTQ